MRTLVTRLSMFLVAVAISGSASAQQPSPDPPAQPAEAKEARSPWLLVPMFSSSPKLGTAVGGLGAYMHVFDPESRVSLFGAMYRYTSTHSQIFSAFARTSSGADHHRVVLIAAFGLIKNDYDDYLGTGQPLKTDDDLKALAGRYLFRAKGNWFIGAQGSAANYQVLGATDEDDLVLETLGVRGFESAGIGATLMHDSRDNEDMPTGGWYLNVNNVAYREALGGAESFDAYRVDLKTFWKHGGGHVLAVRQYNWLTSDAPSAAEATVVLRGYKQGQYLVALHVIARGRGTPVVRHAVGRDGVWWRGGIVRRSTCSARTAHLSDLRSGPAVRAQAQGAHEHESRVRAGDRRQPRRVPEAWLRVVSSAARTTALREGFSAAISKPALRSPRHAVEAVPDDADAAVCEAPVRREVGSTDRLAW